jgi:hypothetical protein
LHESTSQRAGSRALNHLSSPQSVADSSNSLGGKPGTWSITYAIDVRKLQPPLQRDDDEDVLVRSDPENHRGDHRADRDRSRAAAAYVPLPSLCASRSRSMYDRSIERPRGNNARVKTPKNASGFGYASHHAPTRK